MFVKNKQNSSVHFLLRAEFLISPQRRRGRDNAKHYKHSDIMVDAQLSLNHVYAKQTNNVFTCRL